MEILPEHFQQISTHLLELGSLWAFCRWTLVHVGPAIDWGPSAYVYTGFNAIYPFFSASRTQDRQVALENDGPKNDLL